MKETNDNPTMLTDHFSLREMCKAPADLPVANLPSGKYLENLRRLCSWLEMLRSEWNQRYGEGDDPVIVNSGFRCQEANHAVGGAPGSNHLTGCAADIRVSGPEQALRYAVILLDISDQSWEDFDELYVQRSPRGIWWVHFALKAAGNRRRIGLWT